MATTARHITVTVTYDNKDITTELSKYLKSLSYTDELSGSADSLSLTLEDRQGIWQSEWLPDKGASLNVTLNNTVGDTSVNLGIFEIDEITTIGYPSEVQIKAISVPDSNTLRGIDRSQSWEGTTLQTIAQDIATRAELTLVYDVDTTIDIQRAEQTEESDLSFLTRLCNEQGLALKICKGQLVIFDEADYESADPVLCVVKPGTTYTTDASLTYITDITGYSLSTKMRDTYAAAHVKYHNPTTKQLIEATYTDSTKSGKTLEVNEQVASIAEAESLAKKRLREKNCDEVTGTINMVGNFDVMAAMVLQLEGFGAFDGNYIITRAAHSVGTSGYTTSAEIRRCLSGY